MKRSRFLLGILFCLFPALSFSAGPGTVAGTSGLREGDIIFIQSGSSQAPAIAEVMGSSWTHVGVAVRRNSGWFVAEAAGTVSLTPLSGFLDRSRGRGFLVKRLKAWVRHPDEESVSRLKKWLLAYRGKGYDIYFEWSDPAFYCSEYVWKAYFNAVKGHPVLSRPQTFSDLNLAGPLARELIDKRYGSAGKKFNMAEPIVTPAALLNSDLLQTVAR